MKLMIIVLSITVIATGFSLLMIGLTIRPEIVEVEKIVDKTDYYPEQECMKLRIKEQKDFTERQAEMLKIAYEREAMTRLLFDKLRPMSNENYDVITKFLMDNYENGVFKTAKK